ncbi:hypothetical protein BDV06DRAFT_190549 [Aspergillus oleicola]
MVEIQAHRARCRKLEANFCKGEFCYTEVLPTARCAHLNYDVMIDLPHCYTEHLETNICWLADCMRGRLSCRSSNSSSSPAHRRLTVFVLLSKITGNP